MEKVLRVKVSVQCIKSMGSIDDSDDSSVEENTVDEDDMVDEDKQTDNTGRLGVCANCMTYKYYQSPCACGSESEWISDGVEDSKDSNDEGGVDSNDDIK